MGGFQRFRDLFYASDFRINSSQGFAGQILLGSSDLNRAIQVSEWFQGK